MRLFILFIVITIFSLCGCVEFDPTYDELNSLQSEWLLPIAKTSIGFKNIKEISSVEFDVFVSPSDLGYPTDIPVDVLPSDIPSSLGPFIKELPEIIKRIDYDSLRYTVELVNSLPFTLNPGTTVTFRNSGQNTSSENILFSWSIDEPAPAGATITVTAVSSSNYFEEKIYVFLENFQTPGGDNLVFSSIPMTISADFEVIDLSSVELRTNHQILSVDTLNISIEAPGDTFGVSTGGTATIYFDNQLPSNQRFQAYFLNNGVLLDSLFSEPGIINGCEVSFTGDPISIESTRAIAQLSWAKWTKLSQSNQMVIHHYLNTNDYPGEWFTASDKCKINLQLVVDVSIDFNLSEL